MVTSQSWSVTLSSILFLVPYPFGFAPSQRYRFEQYLKILSQNGHSWSLEPFFDQRTWDGLYKKQPLVKVRGTIFGFARRLLLLFRVRKYTWVFIHREAIPFGPPWYEWVVVKIFRRKLIYDFDDAIWLKPESVANSLTNYFRPGTKTSTICRISDKVCVGNRYLASYAERYNRNVKVIPTTIDTISQHAAVKEHKNSREITIGWTGSHSTLPYLDLVAPVIKDLGRLYKFNFLVICDVRPTLVLNCLEYRKWKKKTEIEDLLDIDIGLMPLPKNEWSNGKCGLKALQYMALGIPALVTPVGVNKQIVDHSINGFHCRSREDWRLFIERLISNACERQKMGHNGREKVVKHYSVGSQSDAFHSLFTN